jgi:hypothetical protein
MRPTLYLSNPCYMNILFFLGDISLGFYRVHVDNMTSEFDCAIHDIRSSHHPDCSESCACGYAASIKWYGCDTGTLTALIVLSTEYQQLSPPFLGCLRSHEHSTPIMLFSAALVASVLSALHLASAAPALQPRAACKDYGKLVNHAAYRRACADASSYHLHSWNG